MTTDTWTWNVDGKKISHHNALLYSNAKHRLLHSRQLFPLTSVILSDSYADDEVHLNWVITGKVADILSWARQIQILEGK